MVNIARSEAVMPRLEEASGRCLCGKVRFKAKDVDTNIHACHCSMCRRWSGGPLLSAAVGKVRFKGKKHIGRYDSSKWAERGFCEQCGTNLFYRLKASDHYILCMGAFDDPAPFELVGEIYVDEQPAGYAFAGDHPRQTGDEFLNSLQQG
jgi:hypothetical protein